MYWSTGVVVGKWYRVRARVRDRARAREHSCSFLFFLFFTPKFAYAVTICNFEFCYKRRAIVARVRASQGKLGRVRASHGEYGRVRASRGESEGVRAIQGESGRVRVSTGESGPDRKSQGEQGRVRVSQGESHEIGESEHVRAIQNESGRVRESQGKSGVRASRRKYGLSKVKQHWVASLLDVSFIRPIYHVVYRIVPSKRPPPNFEFCDFSRFSAYNRLPC